MTVQSGVRALRRGWVVLLVGVLAGVLGAAIVSVLTPTTYAARTSVYVAEVTRAEGSGSGIPSMLFAQRIASYQQMIASDRVLVPAARRLGWTGNPKALAAGLSVSSQAGSAVLAVGVSGADPVEAVTRANALADTFVETVAEVERVPGSPNPPGVLVTVIDRAAPATAMGARTSTNLVLGATVGLLAGVAWVLGRAALDTSVRTPDELRRLAGGSVLGVLPRVRGKGAPGPGGTRDDRFDDAVRRLRDQLVLREVGDRGRTLAFCGAGPEAGTTSVVAALAEALAGTGSVLVVDADLRAPELAGRLGRADAPGLSDLLAGRAELDEVVQRGDGPDVVGAGSASVDPGVLLGSRRLTEVLAWLREHYDYVLLDCPAAGPVLDGALVSRQVKATVLVAREGVTSADAVAAASSDLGGASESDLGLVLTGSSSPASTGRPTDVGRADRSTPAGPGDVSSDEQRGELGSGRAHVPGRVPSRR